MDDVFALKSSSFPKTTRVVTFRGREAISRPYEIEIFLTVPGDDAKGFDFAGALGSTATLSLHDDREHPFAFHGLFSIVELVHAYGKYALFRGVLVPRFARLAQTHHSRLFTDQSLPDILEKVFEENGLTSSDYAIQVTGSYPPEEHVCQYHESDLDFVSRWMEHAGLYYFFEQGDESEKLIVTDAKSSHTDLPTDAVRYVPTTGEDRSAGEAIESFRCRATSLPAKVTLTDYDYTKPTLDVSGSAPVAASGFGEINVYASRAFTPGDAAKLAQIRAEELLARQLEHFGSGTVHLRAGYQFTLEEHPLDALNQKYLVIACEHFGNLASGSPELLKRIDLPYPDVYRCEVTAIPAKVQFRAERRTAWPRVQGFEHGVIDGAADSTYAQIDDHGRYRVKFMFDESGLKDGAASTWVRMMQPHGGGVEGFHFPLRKGTEIVLSFWGGDPDRPVIAGVVNTTTTPSPVTSKNHTKNVLQTGGRNRFELEDQEGSQRIHLSTPTANTFVKMGAPDAGHEMTLHTDANALHSIVGNHDHTVGAKLTQSVTGAVSETYSATQTTDITGHQKKNAGSRELTVAGAHDNTSNGAHSDTHNAGSTKNVTGGLGDTIAGGHIYRSDTLSSTVAGLANYIYGPFTVTKASHQGLTMGNTLDVFVGTKISLSAALSTDTTVGLKNSNFIGGSISTTVGPAVAMNLAANASFTAAASATATVGLNASFAYAASVSWVGGVKSETNTVVDKKETPFKVLNAGTYRINCVGGMQISAAALVLNGELVKVG